MNLKSQNVSLDFQSMLVYIWKASILFFIALVFLHSNLNILYVGLVFIVVLIFSVIIMFFAPQKIMLFILIGFSLAGGLLYGIIFLKFTIQTSIPAGLFFDLFIVTIFFAWIIKKFTIEATAKIGSIHSPIPDVVRDLDLLIFLFLFYIVFNYIKGISFKNAEIFSEGRGFIYYLIYFPLISACNIKQITMRKLNRFIFYISLISIFVFFMAVQGYFLQFIPSIVAGERGFTFIDSGLVRAIGSNPVFSIVLFILSFFIFLSSDKKSEKEIAILSMLCNFFIIFRSNTRGYQLTLILALIMSIISIDKNYRRKLLGPFLLTFVLLLTAVPYFFKEEIYVILNRYKEIFLGDPNIIRRWIEVNVFGEAFLKAPIFGNGIGTPQTFFSPNWAGQIVRITSCGPHTEIVYWFYALGIIGAGLYLLILIIIFKMGLLNLKKTQILKEHKMIQKALLIIIFSLIFLSFSSWQFRSWSMVPLIAVMYVYTRNLYLFLGYKR